MGKSRRDVGKGRDDKAALMCGFESAPCPFPIPRITFCFSEDCGHPD